MITQHSSAVLHKSLSSMLAGHEIPAARAKEIVRAISVNGAVVKRLDICAHGICVDFFTKNPKIVTSLIEGGKFVGVEVFPFGIINPDLFLARARMNVPELRG